MNTQAHIPARARTHTTTRPVPPAPAGENLPTAPCSVVWSRGHCYVREGTLGRVRWVGVDDRGRPQFLSDADLRRRGWTLRR